MNIAREKTQQLRAFSVLAEDPKLGLVPSTSIVAYNELPLTVRDLTLFGFHRHRHCTYIHT